MATSGMWTLRSNKGNALLNERLGASGSAKWFDTSWNELIEPMESLKFKVKSLFM